MGVTMLELFALEGREVAVGRGLTAVLRRMGPATEVLYRSVGGGEAVVLVEEGHRLGDVTCFEGEVDARAMCPADIDTTEGSVWEVRSLDGSLRSRSLVPFDAAVGAA